MKYKVKFHRLLGQTIEVEAQDENEAEKTAEAALANDWEEIDTSIEDIEEQEQEDPEDPEDLDDEEA